MFNLGLPWTATFELENRQILRTGNFLELVNFENRQLFMIVFDKLYTFLRPISAGSVAVQAGKAATNALADCSRLYAFMTENFHF